jgi:hypothetical protein
MPRNDNLPSDYWQAKRRERAREFDRVQEEKISDELGGSVMSMELGLMDRVEELVLENKRLQDKVEYWQKCHDEVKAEVEEWKVEHAQLLGRARRSNDIFMAERDKAIAERDAMQAVVDIIRDCSIDCIDGGGGLYVVPDFEKVIKAVDKLEACNSGYTEVAK